MVFSEYTKKRILFYERAGLSIGGTVKALNEEGISSSKAGVWRFLKKYKESGEICRKEGSGRKRKVTEVMDAIIDEELEKDDERTGSELQKILEEKGHTISTTTALRSRRRLGWTCRGAAYCQLIREGNKAKRLEWAKRCIGDTFENVIYTDECSVQLETHRRRACRRVGNPSKPKPRPKHPAKVHVWAGISVRGAH